ncbi:bacteriocin-protection protein, YdeI/OmpD-associated family [Knoellia subterranea KCTC 19937]|uniref:Bacteriocin-protection protein, YdeI/OmpD-associated family n=2 Tax=Knoellia TaxID=136099 RepID=A0A0A0JNR8_9MICO|nr:bacteriocin-protection protein, YdeI/OmpD-associated family [Knoellia subterranea KCTC 19937]
MPGGSAERPATFFRDAAEFRGWLEANHETATELWMGLRKKHVPDRGLTWEDAVPEALCFGWIDSVSQRIDEDSRRQRWTPRKSTSVWSAVNIAHVERLTAEGKMLPAGLAAFERRKPELSGYSYETRQELGDDQRARLLADPAAAAFWEVATASYRKVAENWVVSAKREETREKRLLQLIDECANGRLIPSQRYGDQPKWVERAAAAASEATRPPSR